MNKIKKFKNKTQKKNLNRATKIKNLDKSPSLEQVPLNIYNIRSIIKDN